MADDPEVAIYTFGPRFLLEVGHCRLAHWYYAAIGEAPNEATLAEIQKVSCLPCTLILSYISSLICSTWDHIDCIVVSPDV